MALSSLSLRRGIDSNISFWTFHWVYVVTNFLNVIPLFWLSVFWLTEGLKLCLLKIGPLCRHCPNFVGKASLFLKFFLFSLS